jgi:hypothetical protein
MTTDTAPTVPVVGECSWYDYSCGFEYLANEIKMSILGFFVNLLDGLAALFEMIPVPDFVTKIPTYQLPEFFLYLTDIMQVYEGCQIVMGAYLVRFLIRRLPFIG